MNCNADCRNCPHSGMTKPARIVLINVSPGDRLLGTVESWLVQGCEMSGGTVERVDPDHENLKLLKAAAHRAHQDFSIAIPGRPGEVDGIIVTYSSQDGSCPKSAGPWNLTGAIARHDMKKSLPWVLGVSSCRGEAENLALSFGRPYGIFVIPGHDADTGTADVFSERTHPGLAKRARAAGRRFASHVRNPRWSNIYWKFFLAGIFRHGFSRAFHV